MVNSPPILNSPPIAPNGTRIASTWSNSRGLRLFIRNAIARFDDGQTGDDIYAIDQLRAMNLARQAWNDIRPETIANCWRHAQILSDRKNKGSTDHTPLPNGRGPLIAASSTR
ncbi:BZ3500_MvSof-1268-A1-R1_Chr3-1g06090 [Microbotryum saponariae]|uniref:BZ3500_MvSof-1268-A1-R1_Chr3-1g06090 protein n=1 Tax=Microbotryum saponariae TaxID=289078 RepID=A0A2X0NEW7_9BASI|nr:BZ3500_MvSof-1268-A1-R1_Chr3-1g06090 [Microbotryum saponariae]SDA03946.1 BZ3501_MvSof-1269-A2-R1_Chr3-2g05775 [Microbotryum saponariae]